MFEVNYWGSHPNEGNDDCWTGSDYETLEEALVAFNAPVDEYYHTSTMYVSLVGPDHEEYRKNPDFVPDQDISDDDWKREIAMQAGMMGGVEAYNDTMGY